MASSARVTSVQAITDFKAALLIFCQEAKEVLASIEMENRRMTDWVERDRLSHWQREIRNRQEEMAQAKADLFRKQITRISGQHPDFIEERDALRLATYRLEEAEDKVQLCRRWGTRQLPRAIDEFQGPGRQLAGMVEGNPPNIVLFLDRVIRSLEAYLDLGAPSARDDSAPSSEASSPATKEEGAASEGVTVTKQEPS
jgi:hypothetical protein